RRTMPMRSGEYSRRVIYRLAMGALVTLGSAGPAWAQAPPPAPQPAPAAQPVPPPAPANGPRPSLVFPDGGFPTSPPAPEGGIRPVPPTPEGGIPATPPKPGKGIPYPELQPPTSDYPLPELSLVGAQAGPGGKEYYHLPSAPMPEYYY